MRLFTLNNKGGPVRPLFKNMWEFFHKAVCMNLDRRPDRWEAVTKEFDRVGLEVERFRACVNEENRFLGYNETYHGILSKYQKGGTVLVLEDDVMFKSLAHMPRALNELPPDWDVLYLGANLNGTVQMHYSSALRYIRNSLMSHAIAYSEKMVDYIVDNFDPGSFPIYDEWMRINIQDKFKCFVVAPMVAWQRPGYSDLWQTHANYVSTVDDGNKILL